MGSVSLNTIVYYFVLLVAAECVADIAMVVDSSGSIRDANKAGRKDNYDLIKEVCNWENVFCGVRHVSLQALGCIFEMLSAEPWPSYSRPVL